MATVDENMPYDRLRAHALVAALVAEGYPEPTLFKVPYLKNPEHEIRTYWGMFLKYYNERMDEERLTKRRKK